MYYVFSLQGTMVLAEGYHRLPMLLILPADLPGSFDGKYGAIAYRVVAKSTNDADKVPLSHDHYLLLAISIKVCGPMTFRVTEKLLARLFRESQKAARQKRLR
ncbi:hypothetical protein ANCDUO_05297 [Ancylostoma duodenale]|uniref:Arrestin-like N-terminal domain-containing protein n=1 Tax=Ancylostoma duodenale TaxID=51022 RepID=A0A0C2D4I7_9BILA|nr:hypothetical protein ANCDUO_05297 [Ancylostoma duodenale]